MGTADYKKNRNFEPKAPQSKNAMYKKFSNIFDLIFDPNRYSLDDTFNKGLYLSNAQVEDDLATFIKHPGNNFAVMVGDTGIGKSTYIRKNICSKKVPTIRGDKVFIPFYGNAESVEYTACKSVIRSALDAAIDTIENSTKVLITPEKLYNYIEGHNKRYLFLADNSRQMSKKERLKALLEIDPYAYKAEELKYLCEYSHINDVILVLDDFEGLPNLTQYPFIEALHTYFQCTQNNTENNYSSKLLISLRPETYGMFKRTNVFNTYKPNHIIRIKTPVALKSLLIQRFNYLKSQKIIYGKISNMDAFEEASETFLDILDRFDGKIISLVLGLCNNNFRDAIIVTLSILCNKKWLEHTPIPYGAFKLSVDMFSYSTINVLKALIYLEETIYSDKSYYSHEAEINPLGNIFKNRAGENPILGYYFSVYLFNRIRERGVRSFIPKKEIRDALKLIGVGRDKFDHMYSYILEFNFVREDTELFGNTKVKGIYLLPKIASLSDLVRLSGTYLLAMRDDVWVTDNANAPSSLKFDSASHAAEHSTESKLEWLLWLMKKEEEIIDGLNVVKERRRLVRAFGTTSICSYLLPGIKEDIHATHRQDITSIKTLTKNIRERTKSIERKLS